MKPPLIDYAARPPRKPSRDVEAGVLLLVWAAGIAVMVATLVLYLFMYG